MTGAIVFWLLAAVALAGALVVVFTRDVLRLVLGLAGFLLAVAGLYLYFASPFLAVAQVFVYVGGVLVLMLFALMLLTRDTSGNLELGWTFDIGAASVAIGLFLFMVTMLKDASPTGPGPAPGASSEAIGSVLLGPMLPVFELTGVVLLVALIAVLAIVGGGERR
jgi:NADH:ubiquinone oxidoreductase subunit 6 (subunit J)